MPDTKRREKVEPRLSQRADRCAELRASVESAMRNLGLATDPPGLAPEHWQRVLSSVEARALMRGVDLPRGWRDDLARKMGRDLAGPDLYIGQES